MRRKLMASILAAKSGAQYTWVEDDGRLERALVDLLPVELGLVVFAGGKAALVVREERVDLINPSADPAVQARAETALARAGAGEYRMGYLPGELFPTAFLALRHWDKTYRTQERQLRGLEAAAAATLRGYAKWSAKYVDPGVVAEVQRAWETRS